MSIERLMRAECYAYTRWLVGFNPFWRRLASSLCRRVKEHNEYLGAK